MQKQHTNNIQELLDETNARLRKMEEEHSKEANEAVSIIFKVYPANIPGLTPLNFV